MNNILKYNIEYLKICIYLELKLTNSKFKHMQAKLLPFDTYMKPHRNQAGAWLMSNPSANVCILSYFAKIIIKSYNNNYQKFPE